MSAEKIAFIVGGGPIVPASIQHALSKGYDVYVFGLINDCCMDDLYALPLNPSHIKIGYPEKLGDLLGFLQDHDIAKIVMIGRVSRPNMLRLRPDWMAFKILLRNMCGFLKGGDDTLLRILKAELARFNLSLIGIHTLWPDILAPKDIRIHAEHLSDEPNLTALLKKGWAAAKALGAADIGQSICVAENGQIYKEDKRGTNALIQRAAKEHARYRSKGGGLYLVKTAKPQQDLDMDMPTIGRRTIDNLIKYGFDGVIIEAEKSILHDRDEVFELCRRHNILLASFTDMQIGALR